MNKEITIIKDKRMANTLVWVGGDRYKEEILNGKEVYVFDNKEKITTILNELRKLRIKFGGLPI